MRARSPRNRGNAGWRKVDVTAELMPHVAEQLRNAGSLGGEGIPVAAHAHFDRQGRLRRIHATYENGWRATLVLRLDGSYSLSQAIKLVTQAKGEPA